MKTVSNDFKLNVNSFGRQLDTKIYTWEKAEDGYIPIKGNTTQNGTPTPDSPVDIVNVTGNQEINVTGKNLFNFETFSGFVSGINITISGTNLKATGRASSTSINITNYTTNTFEAGTYTFSLEHKIDTRILLRFYDDNNVTIRTTDIMVGNTSNTITLDGTEKKYRLILNPSNNQEVNIDVNLQFEKGSTPTKYEPYISRSYSISLGDIELCKIGDYQDYIRKSTGKNLFNKSDITSINNGSLVNDVIVSNPISTSYDGVSTNISNYSLSAGTYYISMKLKRVSGTTSNYLNRITITGSNVTSNDITMTANPIISNDYQIYVGRLNVSTSSTITRIGVQLTSGNSNGVLNITDIMVATTNDTNYEPYGKVWYIHKEVGKVVLDGSEDITYYGSGNWNFRYTPNPAIIHDSSSNKDHLISNYFTSKVTGYNEAIASYYDMIVFRYDLYKTGSATDFKNWLSTHNTTVYYVLATATDTIITDTTLIGQLNAIKTLGDTLDRDNIFNINPNFHTNIMETLMKSMNVETDTLIPIGSEIDVYSGVKVGNNYEYINYGHYNVKEYEKDENKKSYIMRCYDDMMKTMVDYDLLVTYPISVKNLLTAICSHFGFTLDTQTFVNDDTLITTDVFSGIEYTYRDVLSELAIATCSTIEIEDGTMYLKYPVNTDLVINEDILNDKNVATSKKYGPVNRLVISRVNGGDTELREDLTSIEQNGLTELKINDKQIFSTETTRDNMIDEMFDYIKGFEYYICDLDTQGLMYVEALDKFNVSVDNITYQTIALNDETNISDGLNEEIYQEEPQVNEDNYKYTKAEDKSLKNAYIEVDKQNARIEAITSETKTYTDDKTNALRSDLQGQINGVDTDLQTYKQTISTQFTQTTESFDFRFNNITDLVGQVSDTENEHYEELIKYIRFVNGVIILGEEGNELTAELSNNRLSFKQNGNEVAYISNKKLYITDTEVLQNIIIGNFAFIPKSNGSLSFRKVR